MREVRERGFCRFPDLNRQTAINMDNSLRYKFVNIGCYKLPHIGHPGSDMGFKRGVVIECDKMNVVFKKLGGTVAAERKIMRDIIAILERCRKIGRNISPCHKWLAVSHSIIVTSVIRSSLQHHYLSGVIE